MGLTASLSGEAGRRAVWGSGTEGEEGKWNMRAETTLWRPQKSFSVRSGRVKALVMLQGWPAACGLHAMWLSGGAALSRVLNFTLGLYLFQAGHSPRPPAVTAQTVP